MTTILKFRIFIAKSLQSGSLLDKMLLIRIIEINKIDAYVRSGRV